MDKHYSEEFFANFLEVLQKVCQDYLQFNESVELSGYLALDIDNVQKERYVLCELLNGAGHVVSESHCTKVFKTVHKKPLHTSTFGNVEIGAQKNVGSTVRNARTCSNKARPTPQIHRVNDFESTCTEFQVDLTCDAVDQSGVVIIANERQTSCITAASTSGPQSEDYSDHEQLDMEDILPDMLASTSQPLEKRRIDNAEFTCVAKKSKTADGNESTSLVTDSNILTRNYYQEQSSSNTTLTSETIGSEMNLNSMSMNEKIRLPLSVTIKQELVDKNQSDSCMYSKSDDLSLATGSANSTQTFTDSTLLQPGSSDSKQNMDFCTTVSSLQHEDEVLMTPPATASSLKTPVKLICSECGLLVSKNSYKRHLMSHDKTNLKCHICSKYLKDSAALDKHQRIHSDTTTVCSYCGKTFKKKSSVVEHIRTVHEANKKYFKCDICEAKFTRSCHLKNHLNTHSDKKPYTCTNNCFREFASKASLLKHEKRCTGATVKHHKHQCDVCYNVFTFSSTLREHIQSQHTSNRFHCICGADFKWRTNLCRHRRSCPDVLKKRLNRKKKN